MNKRSKKYIFITGGVASSLGKGLAAASIASLLEMRGISINLLKMDPYINVDPGTMSPTQHGEVFVTKDGAETDLDLGHYERLTHLTLSKENNFTSGQVYLQVIENEREGKYLGKTVQVVPHITNEIKRRIHVAAENSELLIAEIGGTVGDIESLPFLESIRQFSHDVGVENVIFVHLVLVPYLKAAGEWKTKPAQHSLKELRSIGLFPQMVICRSEHELEQGIIDKLSLFGNVPKQNVFQSVDQELIYQVPVSFHQQGVDKRITELLGIWATEPDMKPWNELVHRAKNPKGVVKIGVIGKYTELVESYKSLDEAIKHAAYNNTVKTELVYIEAQDLIKTNGKDPLVALDEVDGILVPGGFGERGTEGKIRAIQYAREKKIPFLGICLGMQLAIIEFARNVAGITGATSEEFDTKGESIVHYMQGQEKGGRKGGSMRLGSYRCEIKQGTLAEKIYQAKRIDERHRHRLEVNNDYVKALADKGLVFSGINPEQNLVEIIELPNHPYFIACQFHPEFQSKPFAPHPVFNQFIYNSFLKSNIGVQNEKQV
jgi:CTP synthase